MIWRFLWYDVKVSSPILNHVELTSGLDRKKVCSTTMKPQSGGQTSVIFQLFCDEALNKIDRIFQWGISSQMGTHSFFRWASSYLATKCTHIDQILGYNVDLYESLIKICSWSPSCIIFCGFVPLFFMIQCCSNPDATEVFGPTSPSSPHQAWWVVASGNLKGFSGRVGGRTSNHLESPYCRRWEPKDLNHQQYIIHTSHCDVFFHLRAWRLLVQQWAAGILNLEIFSYFQSYDFFLLTATEIIFLRFLTTGSADCPAPWGKTACPAHTHNALRDFSRISMFVWEQRNTSIWTHGLKKPGWLLVHSKIPRGSTSSAKLCTWQMPKLFFNQKLAW